MIIIKVKGRMGNQLFQYALYRKFEVMGKEVYIDNSVYFQENCPWQYELDMMGFTPRVADKKDIKRLAGGENVWNKAWRRLGLKSTYYCQTDSAYHKEILERDNIYLNGYWQSEQYFGDIRTQLLAGIKYSIERIEKNKEFYDNIENTESVCVTIRRGDYLSNPEVKKKYFVCDKVYFESGMEKISRLVKEPVFFAFSDDIDWVRENVTFPGKVYFESGNDPVCEKLRLMSACKHFVISNSSFSWWAQYLSVNEKKIVYAPRQWYADGRKTDIYQENWNYV